MGAQGPQGPAGAGAAARYVVDTTLSFGATHNTIQAAINQAVADSGGPAPISPPTTILVRPGTYTENVTLAGGVHLTAVAAGKSFATLINGQVTLAAGVTSMIGIDISAQTSGGDALTIAGVVAPTQLYISDCAIYAAGADNAAEINVPVSSSSGLIFDNVTFRLPGNTATGVPVNVLSGTIQGRSGTLSPATSGGLPLAPCMTISGAGGNRGRAWLRDPDLFGKVVVSNEGELQVWSGQIRPGNDVAVDDTSIGPILLSNVSLQSLLSSGNVVASNGNLGYTQLSFTNGLQTMPSTATRAAGTDAHSIEAFVGQVSNSAEFVGAGGFQNVKFATVVQNTAPTVVFDPQIDGSIIIRRAGVVSISPTLLEDVAASDDFVVNVRVNGVDVAQLRAVRAASGVAAVSGSHHVRVAANDVVSVQMSNNDVESLPAGIGNQLSMTWTGVR
jgi:hypothetical protein